MRKIFGVLAVAGLMALGAGGSMWTKTRSRFHEKGGDPPESPPFLCA